MAPRDIYLEIGKEFRRSGQNTIGPLIDQDVMIGSADDARVWVNASLGVAPHHVRLVRKSSDTFYLVPVDHNAAVWLIRDGQTRAVPVRGTTVIVPGDTFVLADPQGYSLRLVLQEPQRKKKKKAESASATDAPGASAVKDKASRMGKGLWSEVYRRLYSVGLSSWIGQTAQRAWFFIRTGQFLSPVYIISFLTITSGWTVGAVSCRQASQAHQSADAATSDLATCQSALISCEEGGDDGTSRFRELVAKVMADPTWEQSLDWPSLERATRQEIERIIRSWPKVKRGWFEGRRAPYRIRYTDLENAGMDPAAARLLAWSTVRPFEEPGLSGTKERWRVRLGDDEMRSQCARGPFELSYRQAVALGLTAADDTFYDTKGAGGRLRGSDAVTSVFESLDIRRKLIGLEPLEITPQLSMLEQAANVVPDNANQLCVYLRGDDQRREPSRVAAALSRQLGNEASGVPSLGTRYWLPARVARLYAFDLEGPVWSRLTNDGEPLQSTYVQLETDDAPGHAYVIAQTGRVLGMAIAVRCMLTLETPEGELPAPFSDAAPDFEACAIVHAKVMHDRW